MRHFVSFVFLAFLLSCSGDVVEPAGGCDNLATEYESDDPNVATVEDIINQTCAYSGCHDGAGGIGPGDYSSYDRILRDLESGSFASRVITQRDNPSLGMPPDQSVYPQSRQDSLSTTQLEIITCWLQEGFPK